MEEEGVGMKSVERVVEINWMNGRCTIVGKLAGVVMFWWWWWGRMVV